MPNVERLAGNNDPFVIIKLGTETRKTEPIYEGGGNVTFDALDIEIPVEKYMIDFEPLKIQVLDDNKIMSDRPIGECSTSIKSLLPRRGQLVEFPPISLTGEKANKNYGRVILFLQLDDRKTEAEGDFEDGTLGIPPEVKEIVFKIQKIRAFELKDIDGMLNSFVEAPYVKIKMGEWNVRTPTLTMSKTKVPIFEHLDLESPPIAVSKFLNESLTCEVWNDNIIDSFVGTGSCKPYITKKNLKLNMPLELKMDLQERGASVGRLIIYATVKEKQTIMEEEIVTMDRVTFPEDFNVGYFQINTITGHKLKDVRLLGTQVTNYSCYVHSC